LEFATDTLECFATRPSKRAALKQQLESAAAIASDHLVKMERPSVSQ
jgi:hypothetical protein